MQEQTEAEAEGATQLEELMIPQGEGNLSSGDVPVSEQSTSPELRWYIEAFTDYHHLGKYLCGQTPTPYLEGNPCTSETSKP